MNYTYNVRKIGKLLVFELVDFPPDFLETLPGKIDCEITVWYKNDNVYYTNHPGDDQVDEYMDWFLLYFNSIIQQ